MVNGGVLDTYSYVINPATRIYVATFQGVPFNIRNIVVPNGIRFVPTAPIRCLPNFFEQVGTL